MTPGPGPLMTAVLGIAPWALIVAALYVLRRLRRGRPVPPSPDPPQSLRPPVVAYAEVVSDRPAFDAVYRISPALEPEGGETA